MGYQDIPRSNCLYCLTMNNTVLQELSNSGINNRLEYNNNRTITDLIPQIAQLAVVPIVLVGNTLILWAISRFSSLQKVTYYLLGNLAVADIVYAIGITLNSLCVILKLGEYFLNTSFFLLLMSGGTSLSGTVLVSVHSFLAVRFPVRFRDGFDLKIAGFLLAGMWIFWIAHALAVILTLGDSKLEVAFSVSKVVLNLVHLVILICLQLSTVRQIKKTKRSLRGQGHPITSATLDRLNNMSKIVAIVSTIAVLCCIAWIPTSILILLRFFCPTCGITVTQMRMSRVCFLPNLIGNIVIYFVKSKEFKKVFKTMCKCRTNQVSPEVIEMH